MSSLLLTAQSDHKAVWSRHRRVKYPVNFDVNFFFLTSEKNSWTLFPYIDSPAAENTVHVTPSFTDFCLICEWTYQSGYKVT